MLRGGLGETKVRVRKAERNVGGAGDGNWVFSRSKTHPHLGQAAIPALDTCAWPVPQCVPRCPLAVAKG